MRQRVRVLHRAVHARTRALARFGEHHVRDSSFERTRGERGHFARAKRELVRGRARERDDDGFLELTARRIQRPDRRARERVDGTFGERER